VRDAPASHFAASEKEGKAPRPERTRGRQMRTSLTGECIALHIHLPAKRCWVSFVPFAVTRRAYIRRRPAPASATAPGPFHAATIVRIDSRIEAQRPSDPS